MSTKFNGSTPGLISHNSSASAESVPIPPQALLSDSISTFSLKTSVSEKDGTEGWMTSGDIEKDKVFERDLPFDSENDARQEDATPIAQIRPDIQRQESYWQAGPPAASLYSVGDETVYPEGGLQGWLVVFGSFCGMLSSFGFMNSSTLLPLSDHIQHTDNFSRSLPRLS